MTPSERGKALEEPDYAGFVRDLENLCAENIRLRAEREGCVMVPREPKPGMICGDVAVSTDPRYAGWVFVRHADGINWTTCSKMTPETWAMLAASKVRP